jgi:predicted anti-sigma-YlaC factor YlaD
MNCKETQENLEAFLDGECPRRVRKEIKAHLRNCPHCRESWQEAVDLKRLLHSLPPERCPSSVKKKVWPEIVGEKKRFWGSPSLGWRAILGSTLGVLVISLLIGLHLHHRPSPTYSREEIAKGQAGIELALAYYQHATQLSTDIIERETIPPLRNGLNKVFKTFEKRRNL